ncbi:hypothetical protein AC578_6543 [Pseudocercospora eumusae]|uniref:F-box domain-containing protein n=1 Tax=Pseudocercospora eumusae TaxID=321146 RepID=A0A139HHS1_9PEZI|nr:hypothetical protein AC578_6543 [Pseudocercospora eumusae]
MSATFRTLNIEELLEHIFTFADALDLLRHRRVCRAWRLTIETSIRIAYQERTFLRPLDLESLAWISGFTSTATSRVSATLPVGEIDRQINGHPGPRPVMLNELLFCKSFEARRLSSRTPMDCKRSLKLPVKQRMRATIQACIRKIRFRPLPDCIMTRSPGEQYFQFNISPETIQPHHAAWDMFVTSPPVQSILIVESLEYRDGHAMGWISARNPGGVRVGDLIRAMRRRLEGASIPCHGRHGPLENVCAGGFWLGISGPAGVVVLTQEELGMLST